MLFNKIKATKTLAPLTAEKAKEIYELLKTKDANSIFLEDNIPTEYTKQVQTEMDRLENETITKASGNFIIEPAYPETYNEDGEVDEEAVPAVYYKLTTKKALLESMSSDLLDVSEACSDVEDYYGEYKKDRSFTDFVKLLTNE